jgi:hypothetical protein
VRRPWQPATVAPIKIGYFVKPATVIAIVLLFELVFWGSNSTGISQQMHMADFQKVHDARALLVPVNCNEKRGQRDVDYVVAWGTPNRRHWQVQACWYTMESFHRVFPTASAVDDEEILTRQYNSMMLTKSPPNPAQLVMRLMVISVCFPFVIFLGVFIIKVKRRRL